MAKENVSLRKKYIGMRWPSNDDGKRFEGFELKSRSFS